MNDPEKTQFMEVQIPAPTDSLEASFVTQKVEVPFYENFVCSMVYDSETKNVTPFPETKVSKLQSCGVMPVYKWLSGTYDQVGYYTTKACDGDDWSLDLEKTSITESEDG